MNNAQKACLASICAGAAFSVQAQSFTGPATFTTAPTSQVGTPANALVITSTPNGFVATNTVTVSTPVPAAGTLARWVLDRPFTLSSATTFFTTSVLDGFVAPPPGVFSATAGSLRTFVMDTSSNTIVGGTTSQIPISLINGATTWALLSASSPSFTLAASNFYAVRQVFDLDGVYLAGPGGNWVVDVPAASRITAVPELPTLALMALGLLALAARRAAGRAAG